MDRHYNEIIATYREAELNQRLDMFLACPDLRSEFGLIDQKEPLPDTKELLQWSGSGWFAKIKKVLGATTEFLRRKRSVASV